MPGWKLGPLLIVIGLLCAAAGSVAQETDEAAAAIRALAGAAWNGAERPARQLDGRWQGVRLSVWTDGRLESRSLQKGEQLDDYVVGILRGNGPLHDGQVIDLVLLGDPVRRDSTVARTAATSNRQRGVSALDIRLYDRNLFLGPAEMIAENQSFGFLINQFLRTHGLTRAELESSGTVTSHPVTWLRLAPAPGGFRVARIFRGRREGLAMPVGRAELRQLIDRAVGWIQANMRADGTLPYGYWPSSARHRRDDNAIRQWLATLALADTLALKEGRPAAVRRLLDRNIAGNLRTFYRERHGQAVIRHDGMVKLGALALAGLALLRSDTGARHLPAIDGLARTVRFLRHPDGRFATFLEPAARNDNQNFYPGEALLFLAEQDRRFPDAGQGQGQAIDESLDRYWRWHMRPENRDPSFVPWQLMAHALRQPRAGRPDWRERIFTMADWLVSLQETDDAPAPDMRGRFHAARGIYGPPHASSTAVYLEALCHAARQTTSNGDRTRMVNYAQAASAGFRQLMGLQFTDTDRPPYIAARDWPKVVGGIASTVYDNRIRVDNIAHAISAASCWLQTGALDSSPVD